MSGSDDVEMTVSTDEGPVHVSIARQALARLSGRSHVTAEGTASAYRVEIEDIVRPKARSGEPRAMMRLSEADFSV